MIIISFLVFETDYQGAFWNSLPQSIIGQRISVSTNKRGLIIKVLSEKIWRAQQHIYHIYWCRSTAVASSAVNLVASPFAYRFTAGVVPDGLGVPNGQNIIGISAGRLPMLCEMTLIFVLYELNGFVIFYEAI